MKVRLNKEKLINGVRFKKNSEFTLLGVCNRVHIVSTSAGIGYLASTEVDKEKKEKPLNIKDLPKIEGFSFIALYFDGHTRKQKVFKDIQGKYYIEYSEFIEGWYPIKKL